MEDGNDRKWWKTKGMHREEEPKDCRKDKLPLRNAAWPCVCL